MKTVKVDKIPYLKQTEIVYFFGEIFKDEQRSHRSANKYLVLPLQSDPSNQGAFASLATSLRKKKPRIHRL
jgi:hypothetical protein